MPSWVISGGSKIGIGQYPYLATAAATYAFTPTTQFDTIEIFYLSDPTFGTKRNLEACRVRF